MVDFFLGTKRSKKRNKIRKQKLADQKETRIKKLIKKTKKENKLKIANA